MGFIRECYHCEKTNITTTRNQWVANLLGTVSLRKQASFQSDLAFMSTTVWFHKATHFLWLIKNYSHIFQETEVKHAVARRLIREVRHTLAEWEMGNKILFYPSALRAGGVLSSWSGRAGGRPGGRLPNLRNPYLCNCLMDFLHSKFCGIV